MHSKNLADVIKNDNFRKTVQQKRQKDCIMRNSQNSNSAEQQMAERILFEKVKQWLNIDIIANEKIPIGKTFMQPDFYSKKHAIIGEIFSHIGKPKKAQDNKIANDILKMLLLEKSEHKTYRKIIVVCDEEERIHLEGISVLSECIRQFGIEIKLIEIDADLRTMLTDAQKRQQMINA